MLNLFKKMLGVSMVDTTAVRNVADIGVELVKVPKVVEVDPPLDYVPSLEDYVEKESGLFAGAGLDEIAVGYERQLPPLDIMPEVEAGAGAGTDNMLLENGIEVLGGAKPCGALEEVPFIKRGVFPRVVPAAAVITEEPEAEAKPESEAKVELPKAELLEPRTSYEEIPHGKMTASEFAAKVVDCAKDFYIDEEGDLRAKNPESAPLLSRESERLIKEYRTRLLWKIHNAAAVRKNSYPELNRAFVELGYKGPSELKSPDSLVQKELAYVAENAEWIGRASALTSYNIPRMAKDFRLDMTGKLKSAEGYLETILPKEVLGQIRAYRVAQIAKVHNAVNVLHKADVRVVRPLMNLGYKGTSAVKNGAADLKEEMLFYATLCAGRAVMANQRQR